MNRKLHRLVLGAGVLALAAPAATVAQGKARSKAKNPVVSYEFKGELVSADPATGSAVVHVRGGNRHARPFRGEDVEFDLTRARIVIPDRNADGKRNLADASAGDVVNVQSRMRRRLAEPTQPFPAKRMVDRAPRAEANRADEQVSASRRGRARGRRR